MALRKHKGSLKEQGRLRRSGRISARISVGTLPRLRVKRSNAYTSVQLQSPAGEKTYFQISTKDLGSDVKAGVARSEAAKKLGALAAEKAVAAGIKKVAFDRAGYKYHGVVKALADAAREGGLDF